MSELGRIHDEVNELDEQEKKIKRARRRKQNACPHTVRGKVDGVLFPSTKDGRSVYCCKKCKKNDISMEVLSVEEGKKHIAAVRNMLDNIKINQGDSPQALENVKFCAETLDRLDNAEIMYENLNNKRNKKKSKDKDYVQRTAILSVPESQFRKNQLN